MRECSSASPHPTQPRKGTREPRALGRRRGRDSQRQTTQFESTFHREREQVQGRWHHRHLRTIPDSPASSSPASPPPRPVPAVPDTAHPRPGGLGRPPARLTLCFPSSGAAELLDEVSPASLFCFLYWKLC